MTNVKKFNEQSVGEEIANAISHGVGALLGIGGTVVLIIYAVMYGDVWGVVSSCIYGGCLIILYTMSTLYHSLTNYTAKKVFQVFDHCSIFLLIFGTYTPICLITLKGGLGWTLFGINAFFTVLGIVLNSISVAKWHKASLICYLVMGWSVVFAIKPLLANMPINGLWLLLGGGLFYTLGVIFYKAKKPRFMHFIWHFFVLGGSILHYFLVLFYIIPIK